MKIELYGIDKELQETIHLERFESRGSKGYNYSVHNALTGVIGYVEVRLKDIDWFVDREEPVADILGRLVLEDETIAEIQRFYPHKEPLKIRIPSEVLRRGVGTGVLQTVVADLRGERIRHFYCFNPAEDFYRILLKQRFRELHAGDTNEHLFRRFRV